MIRFDCTCGKSLKAAAKLAGKNSRCPACGVNIIVPQLSAARPGNGPEWPTQAALTMVVGVPNSPDDGESVYRLAAAAPTAWVPNIVPEVDPNYVPPAPYQRHPIESWTDPLAGAKYVLSLSGMLAVLTALGVALYPHVLHEGLSWVSGLFLAVVWAGGMVLVIGYGCSLLYSNLEWGLCGGGKDIHVPDYDPGPAMTSFVRWALCFGSGPAFLIYFAFLYWIHCGDMTLIDGVILAELTVPAVTWWMMELLVLAARPDRVHVAPVKVLSAIRRLGPRALLAGIASTAVGFIHVWLGAGAVMLLHEAWLPGLLLLWLCWFSAWQCSAFALRKLGCWQRRIRECPA